MADGKEGSAKTARPLRADALRNREAIIQAAREVFEIEGVMASLDGIALRAGVGNATLYRNFPTRNDLLAAVVEESIEIALEEADALALFREPREALAEWLVLLTWRLRIWHDLPDCIAAASTEPDSSMNSASARLLARTGTLLDQAKTMGGVIEAISANEVFELITALSWAVDRFGDDENMARRRVEVATAGIFVRT